MALIKSSQLIKTGTAVVAGDQILKDEPPPVSPAPETPASLERVIAAAEDPLEPELESSPVTEFELPLAAAPELENEGPWQSADAELLVPVEPESLLEAFDAERAEFLTVARMQASEAVQEAVASRGPADPSIALEEASHAIGATYEAGTPAFQEALHKLSPFVEAAVQAAHAEMVLLAEQDARWREAGSTEEQMAALIDNYARRVLDDPPLERSLHSLLAEREAILADARLQAATLVQGAQAQAARLVVDAQAQAAQVKLEVETSRERLLTELRQTGYAEGYQEGRSQADEEGAKHLRSALEELDKLAGIFRVEVKKNEDKLLKLAIGIAEKLIQAEISQNPETVLRVMDEAISKVSDLEEVTLKVHPDDMPLLQQHEEAFRERLRNVRKVEFVANPKIQKGSVFIETASGTVDATFKTQLSVIQEAFDVVRAEYGAEPMNMTGST